MNDPQKAERTADTVSGLVEQVDQLRQAVDSHASIDQAIGIVVALGQVAPEQGWEVLREVSQHTNIKLRAVADLILAWGQNGDLPAEVRDELGASLARRAGPPPAEGPVT
ncbi:ANTAR domain-containing protein [Streptomyces sp. NPDC087300]|uniref:ANTAR domain-containing protein n=1 Tax=Streptomyces sp. NPDC087300 TaxID=3365780 RepID=UPI0038296DC2